MRRSLLTGMLLMVLGIAVLADHGLRYTDGIAPFEPAPLRALTPIPWPPIVAALALAAGAALVLAGSRRF